MRNKKFKKIILVIGIILMLGVALFSLKSNIASAINNTPTVKVTSLKQEKISEKVLTQGKLKFANQQVVYYSPENGEISNILVDEGQKVKVGTPLLKYEDPQTVLEKKQNELQLKSTTLQLHYLQQKHREVDKQLKEVKKNYGDIKEEDKKKTSQNGLVNTLENKLQTVQEEHNQVELQEKQANIDLEKLQLQNESINQKIKKLSVTSNIEGTVVKVNEKASLSSDQLNSQPIIQIGTNNKFVIEATISEYDSLNIKKGQSVKLTSDVLPDKVWTGEVSYISNIPKETVETENSPVNNMVQYSLEIAVKEDKVHLKPGFQMNAEITTNQFEAMVLPLTSVKSMDEIKYVFIVSEGKVEKREVKVGTTSTESIEVKQGIDKDEQVIINPDDNIIEGMEVEVEVK